MRSILFSLLLALTPAAASAVTVDQIVALSKAGVSEPIILALIDRDRTVFTIEPEQLVALRRDGLSEAVILAMLKSGRQEGEASANEAAAFNAAVIMSAMSVAPEVIIVGHGPERPNVGYQNGFSDIIPLAIPYGVPYGSPYDGVYGRRGSRRFSKHQPLMPDFPPNVVPIPPPPSLSSPALCNAYPTTSGAPPMIGSRGFVMPCPSQLLR